MPLRKREGGPADDPEARRPAERAVCLPRGSSAQKGARVTRTRFAFRVFHSKSSRRRTRTRREFMNANRFWFAAAFAAIVLSQCAFARADDLSQSAPAGSPTSAPTPAAQVMSPIVVTATRIPEPAAQIGTT